MPKDKAEIMRANRKARKEELESLGLTRTLKVHINPEDEARVIKYIESRLRGKVYTK